MTGLNLRLSFLWAGGAGHVSGWCSLPLWGAEEQCGAAAAVWAAGPQPRGAARSGIRAPHSTAAWHWAPEQSSAPAAAQRSHGLWEKVQSSLEVCGVFRFSLTSSLTLYTVSLIRSSSSSWDIILGSCSTWPGDSRRAPSRGGTAWWRACRMRWLDCTGLDWRKEPGCRKHYR